MYEEHSESELWGIVERYTADRENHIIKEYFLHNKLMPEIAREQNVTVSRMREIKENDLRKLRRGKVKRELYGKFEIVECGIDRNRMSKAGGMYRNIHGAYCPIISAWRNGYQ